MTDELTDSPQRSEFQRQRIIVRLGFNAKAAEGLSACDDIQAYRRWLDDAEAELLRSYTSYEDPLWDQLSSEMDVGGGELMEVIGEGEPRRAQMLLEKRDYRDNLEKLLNWLPRRKQYWLSRFVTEQQTSERKRAEAGAGIDSAGFAQRATNVAGLPEVSPEANERIDRALNDAIAHLKGRHVAREDRNTAMVHCLDVMAWEYMVTRSAATFESLIDVICEKARNTIAGDQETASDRKRHWVKQAREREANGIIGTRIPVRVDPKHTSIFHELQLQFRALPGSGRI